MTKKQYQEALLAAYLDQWLKVFGYWATRSAGDGDDEGDGDLPPFVIVNKNAKGDGGEADLRTDVAGSADGGDDDDAGDDSELPFVPGILVDGPETEVTDGEDEPDDAGEEDEDLGDWDDADDDDEDLDADEDLDGDFADEDGDEPDDAGDEEAPNGDEMDPEDEPDDAGEEEDEPSGWSFLNAMLNPQTTDDTSTDADGWRKIDEPVHNADSVFSLSRLEMAELMDRQLSRAFARVVELLGDDASAEDLDMGTEKVSMRRVVERAANKALSPRYAIVDKKRTKVNLVLDTSGSCASQSDMYRKIAAVAAKHGDVRIFDGPNAHVMREYNPKTGNFDELPGRQWLNLGSGVSRQPWPSFMDGDTVLFFGDADGWELIVEASWRMNVYWLTPWDPRYGTPPTRASEMGGSTRVSDKVGEYGVYNNETFRKGLPTSQDQFKGQFYVASTADDLIRVSKKIRTK